MLYQIRLFYGIMPIYVYFYNQKCFIVEEMTEMRRKFDFVLFDFDGTVADTGRGITRCALEALRFYGYDEPDKQRLRRFIGPPLIDSFMQLYGADEELAKKMVDKYREHYSAGGMFECDFYGGVPEMLEALESAGCKMAIASSKPGKFVEKILENLGADRYFSFISAPEIGHVNPTKAELITKAMQQLGAKKESTVMVGDRLFDIEGAKQVGIKSIGAVYGFGSEAELREYAADMLAFEPRQIKELILDESNS